MNPNLAAKSGQLSLSSWCSLVRPAKKRANRQRQQPEYKPLRPSHLFARRVQSQTFSGNLPLWKNWRAQNVQPLTDVQILFGTWPGDEDDGFEEAVYDLRHAASANDGRQE